MRTKTVDECIRGKYKRGACATKSQLNKIVLGSQGTEDRMKVRGVQLMGRSTKCCLIENGAVECPRRGRDGWAGPPGASY